MIAANMDSALNLRTTTYSADTFKALKARLSGSATSNGQIHFRSHYAVAFNKGEVDVASGVNRREAVRAAFNSPFRPFVLASTSIGQEGLDFHLYCRKIFHWNLPSNPVDFEQREGRVDRYKGLSVRQSLAVRFADKHNFTHEDDLWGQVFATARRETERKGEESGLSPFWRLSGKTEVPVESIVPLLAFSRDEIALARIQYLMNVYRLALGQPRQEELLDRFNGNAADAKKLFLNLCPFARGRR